MDIKFEVPEWLMNNTGVFTCGSVKSGYSRRGGCLVQSRVTCDPWAHHTRMASLGTGGMEPRGPGCYITMDTWSSGRNGLVL